MHLAPLEIDVDQAKAGLAEYTEALRHERSVEDEAIAAAYRAAARGLPVISLAAAITAGGFFDNGLPRIAVIRADATQCTVERWWSDSGLTFTDENASGRPVTALAGRPRGTAARHRRRYEHVGLRAPQLPLDLAVGLQRGPSAPAASRPRSSAQRQQEDHQPAKGATIVDTRADPLVTALRDRRLALGLTLAEFARRLHVDPRTISRIESGTHSPVLATLRRWAAVLDYDIYTAPRLVGAQFRPCGTVSAARRHRAHAEPLDDLCRAAERGHSREYKRARAKARRRSTSEAA